MSHAEVERYAALFRGNDRSYGVWLPDTTKMMTEKSAVTLKEYEQHLKGERGLGVVPITDSGHSWFGVIDIDNHGDTKDIDLVAMVKKITEKSLPLVACRSKSGGIHVYVFCKEPVRSKVLRVALEKWASQIGYPKAEIFPKQDYLDTEVDGEKRLGNWINLCYFNAKDSNRATVDAEGKILSLSKFLSKAESLKISTDDLTSVINTAHIGAPPCIQRLLSEGVPAGARNEAMYNITVYLKRAKPNTYLDDALDINNEVFDPPLPTVEAKRTIKSASRRDYKYRCGLDPIKSLCDSKTCVNREFGITKSEFDDMSAGAMLPTFSNIVKYKTDPVKWGIMVTATVNRGDGTTETKKQLVDNIPTEVLYNFEHLKNRITEALTIGVPSITKRRWEGMLIPLIADARVVLIPEDASISGMIGGRLMEFLDKVNLDVTDMAKEREKILRGMPCVIDIPDRGRSIAFRAMDFVKYLKSVKSEDVKGPNLWFALKNIPNLELDHYKIKVKGKSVTVWFTSLATYVGNRADHSMPSFKAEF